MRLVALNERIAAYEPGGSSLSTDPRTVLNHLLAARSWKSLISLLKTDCCSPLFAKREAEPLWESDGLNVTAGPSGKVEATPFAHLHPSGQLISQIERDRSLDYLDNLTKADLLKEEGVYEVQIQELLAYREELRRFLLMAAVALGAEPPKDMFNGLTLSQVIESSNCGSAENYKSYFKKFFGKHGELKAVSFNESYWPISYLGPFAYDGPLVMGVADGFGDDLRLSFSEEWQAGILAGSFDAHSVTRTAGKYVFFYDSSEHDEETACRLFCGLTVARIIDSSNWDYVDHYAFIHDYLDEPDLDQAIQFSLSAGFQHPRIHSSFQRWQSELVGEAIEAVFSKRIALCAFCKTPIILASNHSRNEYCCDSHKTLASMKRRNQVRSLRAKGVSLEDAIAEIGLSFEPSVRRWYREIDSPLEHGA